MIEAMEQTPNLSASVSLHLGGIPLKASLSLEMYCHGVAHVFSLYISSWLSSLTEMVSPIIYLFVNLKFKIYSLSLHFLLPSPPLHFSPLLLCSIIIDP